MSETDQVLVFCQATASTRARSGIHRVCVELASALCHLTPTRLVGWDEIDGQLRFLDYDETHDLFLGDIPEPIKIPLESRRVNCRFADIVSDSPTHFLFPEIPYHLPHGNEIFSRIITQCREAGISTSAIYYDAIPVTNNGYSNLRRPHIDYLTELVRLDSILAISQTSAEGLANLMQEAGLLSADFEHFKSRLNVVLLPEGTFQPVPDTVEKNGILMLGSVEPRKRQLHVMRAINELRLSCPSIAKMKVDVVGSLHPEVAEQFQEEIAKNPKAKWHHYIADAKVESLYATAAFSVFASNDEGYGLPIAESLVRGVPCITANFGSMQEVAAGGGCLTVDVNDNSALRDAIRRLAEDDELRQELREQIEHRFFRTWNDYAKDILDGLSNTRTLWPDTTVAPIELSLAFCYLKLDEIGRPQDGLIFWSEIMPEMIPNPETVVATIWNGSEAALKDMEGAEWKALCASDVACFANEGSFIAVMNLAAERNLQSLLPSRIVIESNRTELEKKAYSMLLQAARGKAVRLKVSYEERMYARVRKHFAPQGELTTRILSLVISTYNRKNFVVANAHWLSNQIARFGGKVDLTIVDNASTDGSWAALQSLVGVPHVSLVQNPANVGMLGNLRVCSALQLARHVWITGDDDFITADALDEVVTQLEKNPGLSLGFVNFAVYHRHSLSTHDSPSSLQKEGTVLGTSPAPNGMRRVCEIAAEHDNLFTAVYPILFRSDLLSACFNYPFQGVPFIDLVESVPTTKMILGTYAQCEAFWFGGVGIVGNAFNSWSRHRPRWHAHLMPLVFEAAREAGVDEHKLRIWADAHLGLYEEAVGIARDHDVPVHFDGEDDLKPGTRVFLKQVEVPDDLRRWKNPSDILWDGR